MPARAFETVVGSVAMLAVMAVVPACSLAEGWDGIAGGCRGPCDAGQDVCDGLTMVLRLDGNLRSAQGQDPQPGQKGAVAFREGRFGQAVTFSGGTPLMNYDSRTDAGAVALADVGTVTMWVKLLQMRPEGCDAGEQYFSFWGLDQGDNNVGGMSGELDCNGSADILAGYINGKPLADGDGNVVFATLSPSWTKNPFTHLAFTWSKNQLSIAFNGGSPQSTGQTWTPAISPSAAISILGNFAAYDDVAVWTRALSADEIANVYNAGRSMADVCSLP